MPRNHTNAQFQHPDNAAYRSQLREAIKSRKNEKKEMKVGKPVDLQLTSECECAICLERLSANNISVTPCGHKFCFTCLAENMRRSQKCPMCRATLAKRAKGKEMNDEKFSEIHFEDTDIIYSKLRKLTKGLNHIFQEHAFMMGRGMNAHMLTIDPEMYEAANNHQEENNDIPEHLQTLGAYADDITVTTSDGPSTMYEFNEHIREHPRVGGLRLPNLDLEAASFNRSSAPSPVSQEEDSDSEEEDSDSEDDSDSDDSDSSEEENDIIDEVIDDMETDDGRPMWAYEKAIMRLVLDSRAEGMASVCDWYEEGTNIED